MAVTVMCNNTGNIIVTDYHSVFQMASTTTTKTAFDGFLLPIEKNQLS